MAFSLRAPLPHSQKLISQEIAPAETQTLDDQETRLLEADVKKLASQTGYSEEKAKEILKEREFYSKNAMTKGISRQEAEKLVDSVYLQNAFYVRAGHMYVQLVGAELKGWMPW